jgi:DNA-binding GntR family transcriptional regulator
MCWSAERGRRNLDNWYLAGARCADIGGVNASDAEQLRRHRADVGKMVARSKLTKRDQVAQQLRQLIASGEIPRGSRVRQDELAERFDVSITPIREAIRLLHAEGILVGEPRKGVRVAAASPDRLRSTYVARRLLETYAMQRASRRMSAMDLRQAEDLATRIETAYADGDHTLVGLLNRDFHFTFYDNCGLPGLIEEIETLWQNFPWDVMKVLPDRTPESLAEHRRLLDVVAAADDAGIDQAVGVHLWGSYRRLIKHLTGQEPLADPYEVDVPD